MALSSDRRWGFNCGRQHVSLEDVTGERERERVRRARDSTSGRPLSSVSFSEEVANDDSWRRGPAASSVRPDSDPRTIHNLAPHCPPSPQFTVIGRCSERGEAARVHWTSGQCFFMTLDAPRCNLASRRTNTAMFAFPKCRFGCFVGVPADSYQYQEAAQRWGAAPNYAQEICQVRSLYVGLF